MTDFANNWNDLSNQLRDLDGLFGSPTTHANSPSTSYLDDAEMSTFGSFPLSSVNDDDEALKVVNCKDCARPVQKSALDVHLVNCAKMRQISQSKQSTNKKAKSKKEDTPTPGDSSNRKRRLSDASQQSTASSTSPLKKSRKLDGEPKSKNKAATTTKEKPKKDKDEGPVDLDSQCGVINAKGIPCSRSLTCKTHPMGAKRAVEGRSKPYDVLTYEFEVKRKPELADKPLPKAVTQFEADKAATIKKKATQPSQTPKAPIAPSFQPPQPPTQPPTPVIVEKPVGVTSWDDVSQHGETPIPAAGIELELEITKIRAATTNHHARPLALPSNRMAGLVKKRTTLRRCLMKSM